MCLFHFSFFFLFLYETYLLGSKNILSHRIGFSDSRHNFPRGCTVQEDILQDVTYFRDRQSFYSSTFSEKFRKYREQIKK